MITFIAAAAPPITWPLARRRWIDQRGHAPERRGRPRRLRLKVFSITAAIIAVCAAAGAVLAGRQRRGAWSQTLKATLPCSFTSASSALSSRTAAAAGSTKTRAPPSSTT